MYQLVIQDCTRISINHRRDLKTLARNAQRPLYAEMKVGAAQYGRWPVAGQCQSGSWPIRNRKVQPQAQSCSLTRDHVLLDRRCEGIECLIWRELIAGAGFVHFRKSARGTLEGGPRQLLIPLTSVDKVAFCGHLDSLDEQPWTCRPLTRRPERKGRWLSGLQVTFWVAFCANRRQVRLAGSPSTFTAVPQTGWARRLCKVLATDGQQGTRSGR